MLNEQPWGVLLIGGSSAAGKSTVAAHIGRRFGIPWFQIDDLRLAFLRAQATLPEGSAAIYYDRAPNVWQQPPQHLRDSLVAVGGCLRLPSKSWSRAIFIKRSRS